MSRSAFVIAIAVAAPLLGCATRVEGTSDGAAPDIAVTCFTKCPACAAGQVCLDIVEHQAICRPRCNTDDDCAAGDACISLHRDPDDIIRGVGTWNMTDRACATKAAFVPCPGTMPFHCDIFASPHCLDSSTLRSVVIGWGGSCGWRYMHCPNGCKATSSEKGACA